jgi:hypothetical protein
MREWINHGLDKLKDMSRVVGKVLLMQLSPVETIHKEFQGRLQRFRTARKATRAARQTSQIMAQLCVVGFHRVGVGLTLGDFIHTPVIPQAFIGIKGIAEVTFRFGSFVDNFLNGRLGAFPHHSEAQIAAGETVYDRDDENLVFLSPIKVNNSSISASLTLVGTGGSGKLSACAWTHRETVRW